jgi:hypothetical protein
MNISINEIPYGNPDRLSIVYLKKDTYLDTLLEELKNSPFPLNDSEKVKTELQEISVAIQNTSNTPEILEKFKIYDSVLDTHIIDSLVKQGVDGAELKKMIDDLNEDVLPLITKLKYHYQRIRPYQLSKLYDISLIPYPSLSANTPSYPSGHTIQSRIYAEVLGNRYPKFYKALHELATDVMWSRLYMGVHYPSDCQFGDYVAQVICNHPDFKKKYKL